MICLCNSSFFAELRFLLLLWIMADSKSVWQASHENGCHVLRSASWDLLCYKKENPVDITDWVVEERQKFIEELYHIR